MKTVVKVPDPAAEFMTPEGCAILESWNDESDPDVSIARATVAPGVTTQPHRLRGVVERYVIIQGRGSVRTDIGQEQRVGPGDVVVFRAGAAQQIRNSGSEDLVFYCVCSPRFTPDCYEALPE
jgi:mannose-6-phosphate isomerase-like protein (cupin superfamily)